ncbi:MAG: hypothetical protein RMM98_13855 [Acidobacteriota bacterium]|nr:hypothetical protein [Blastocatellia bacterium]MDW8240689.1 hypothetical protein [Acidobacteriota bacterium]
MNAAGDVFAGTVGGGVFRSRDNGQTWQPVNTGLTNLNVSAFVVKFTGDIFAGTHGGIFRSRNNGNSWQPVNTGLTPPPGFFFILALAVNRAADVFAGLSLSGGVYHLRANSNAWGDSSAGLPGVSIHALALNRSGRLFAGTGGRGVFRTRQ